MATLFISDLHLDPERPAITGLFIDFLATRTRHAEALYILGDLFEAWVGDDDDSDDNRRICAALAACPCPVFVMRGNRDFLLGERFAELAGCTMLDDPAMIDLHGTQTLLMHGDLLCTDDTGYMAFRETVRDPAWQNAMLDRPLPERRAIAAKIRRDSRAQTSGKPESIMDVNNATVTRYMSQHGVSQLIHGHTHRPAVHQLELAGRPARRIVLGDWYEQGSVLECSPAGCRLQQLPLPV